jgi:hypothetical protein
MAPHSTTRDDMNSALASGLETIFIPAKAGIHAV